MNSSTSELIEKIVAEIDASLSVKSHTVFKAIVSRIDAWRDADKQEALPDEVKWELIGLDMRPVSREHRQEAPDNRFAYIDDLPTDELAINYYRQRIQATPNPVRKARYADFVWLTLRQRGDRDHYLYGIEAAEAYLDQVPLCLDQGVNIELADGLDRAAEIAILLNNQKLSTRIVDSIIDTLQQFDSETRSRWVRELGYTLLYISSKYPDLITSERLQQIKEFCDNGIARYTSKDHRSLHLAHELMQLASSISEHFGNDAAWTYQVQIAESFMEEARRLESEGTRGSKLAAYKFTENAMHFYLRLLSLAPNIDEKQRLQERVEEAKREVRRLIRLGQSEMIPIGASLKLSQVEIEAMIAPLLAVEPDKICEKLPAMPFLLPDIDHIRHQANEAAQKYLFTQLFGNLTLRDGRKVDEIEPGEGETVHFFNRLNNWLQVHSQLLDIVLSRLKEEGHFSVDSFLAHLRTWELLDEADVPFIEVGLERYFAGDFISALHVLTPHIEHMLKSAFEQAGILPIAIPNQYQIREQTFGDFLCREEVRQVLGENVWYYLYYSLVDEKGLNIRNDIAHGWITAPNCDRLIVQIVLFTILLITGLREVPKPDEENPSTTRSENNQE